MDVRTCNEDTRSFWNRAASAVKFEKDGLWGLKTPSGDVLLKPVYDQIEFCTDFVYAHYGDRHVLYYKDGGSRDCQDRVDDYRFYENGMIGLKNSDGTVFLPADYDEIIDWGEDCDVVYVRKGEEYHYYTHQHEEILTEVEEIPEDEYPLIPYNLGEDQNREVLLCIEPIDKKEGNRDCYAYKQWVRLSRIPRSAVRELFSDCKVVRMSPDEINHFEDEDTYIYSARICTSKDDYPLTACIKKLKSLGCYKSSWNYLIKISVNNRTKIDPYDFYNVIKHFENDLDGEVIRYNIAIDYDESLADGEFRLFQIHYFWDDGGAFLYDDFRQEILPDGSVEDIKKEIDAHSPIERRKMIINAFWSISRSDKRSWCETRKVLDYLKSEGCDNFSLLVACNMDINPYWMEHITPEDWKFKKNMISWGLANGGQLNQIHNGKTLFESYMDDLNRAKENIEENSDFQESIRNAEKFASWLVSKGAITAAEQRMKIEAKLDGLSPQEVLDFIASV